MYWKKCSSSRCETIFQWPRASHAPHARLPAALLLHMISVSLKFPAMLGCILAAGVLFTACTPPAPVIQKCPKPLWKLYASFQPDQIREETARLEALLARGDTSVPNVNGIADSTDPAVAEMPSGLDIRRRLFELSIHHANPECNLDRILGYASLLYLRGGPDTINYLNWSRAIKEQKALLRERDSLEAAFGDFSATSEEKDKKESRSVENLKKEIKTYLQQRDSLTAVIATQQEMIMKLQKLDVMMEQQRSKIQ